MVISQSAGETVRRYATHDATYPVSISIFKSLRQWQQHIFELQEQYVKNYSIA